MITLECRVWGRVQGVGFRYFTKRLADQLHLRGSVENKIDGSVVMTIQAPAQEAYAFVDRIQNSPPSPYATIRKISLTLIDDAPHYRTFDIRY